MVRNLECRQKAITGRCEASRAGGNPGHNGGNRLTRGIYGRIRTPHAPFPRPSSHYDTPRDDLHDLRDRYRGGRDLPPHDGTFLNLCIEGISVLFWACVSKPHATKRRLLQWSQSKQAEHLLALGLHRYSLQVVCPRHTTRIRRGIGSPRLCSPP